MNGADQCAMVAGHPDDHRTAEQILAGGPWSAPITTPVTKPPKSRPAPSLILLVVGLVVVVAWLGTRGGATPSTPTAGGAQPARPSQHVSGTGISNSAPVQLSGSYRVDWTATDAEGRDCYHGTSLRTTSDRRAAELVATEVHGSGSGTVYVYDLPQGSYFVEANSGCDDWGFTFTPS
jgi:hypothetical protein